jgi:hypothetical protein
MPRQLHLNTLPCCTQTWLPGRPRQGGKELPPQQILTEAMPHRQNTTPTLTPTNIHPQLATAPDNQTGTERCIRLCRRLAAVA